VILHSLRERALLVAPIRLGLGILWVLGARLSGATPTTVLLAFAGGAFVTVFTIFNDPRSRFLRRPEPVDAPPDAKVATRLRQALQAMLPSTVGVSVLAAIAVIPYPALAAFLGGISAGLGLAGALSAIRTDPELFVDVGRGVLYRKAH
jgi:hypothetical protein